MKDKAILFLVRGVLALLVLYIVAEFFVAVNLNQPFPENANTVIKMSLTGIIGVIAGYMGNKGEKE
jgi:uncharacterized protein YhhL (DUF1145 family)